jgi:hypothetical protein
MLKNIVSLINKYDIGINNYGIIFLTISNVFNLFNYGTRMLSTLYFLNLLYITTNQYYTSYHNIVNHNNTKNTILLESWVLYGYTILFKEIINFTNNWFLFGLLFNVLNRVSTLFLLLNLNNKIVTLQNMYNLYISTNKNVPIKDSCIHIQYFVNTIITNNNLLLKITKTIHHYLFRILNNSYLTNIDVESILFLYNLNTNRVKALFENQKKNNNKLKDLDNDMINKIIQINNEINNLDK